MAWIEDETWDAEQGIDAVKTFEIYEDVQQTIPWQFVGWDVNATISDARGKQVFSATVDTSPTLGKVRLIVPEAVVNSLKVDSDYRYDCLMVPPGVDLADDHYLATGPFAVALRTTRRDP
jgi:hypothetical protein